MAAALALACLSAVASASLLPPNSSALLFKNEALASAAAKNVSVEALRAHAAGLAAAALPDKTAALLSKPRPFAYPEGVCRACAVAAACPGRTCAPGACPSYVYPGAAASRAATPCASNFAANCADPANAECPTCALWQEVASRCAPMGAQPAGCVSRGDYAVLRSRDAATLPNNVVALCTTDQYLIIPTRPCTGVESEDPLCTGSKAEYWWGAAFDEAVVVGVAPAPLALPPPASTTLPVWGRDVPVAPNTPTWAVAVNAANQRTQHQTHIRFAKWQPVDDGATVAYSNILPDWLAVGTFSVDENAPTRTGPAAPTVDGNGNTQWPLIATVFVATGAKPDAGAAKVWATASKIAHAVDPARPYGIMIAPRWQAAFGLGGGPVVPGVTVSAVFDLGAGQILEDKIDTTNCVGTCAGWDKLWWEGKGARPAPFKSWLQQDESIDASAAIPPQPVGYTVKDWYQQLGLSW